MTTWQIIYIICVLVLLIGGLNWGFVGACNFDLVRYINKRTFRNENFVRLIYILIGIAALILLFDKNLYTTTNDPTFYFQNVR